MIQLVIIQLTCEIRQWIILRYLIVFHYIWTGVFLICILNIYTCSILFDVSRNTQPFVQVLVTVVLYIFGVNIRIHSAHYYTTCILSRMFQDIHAEVCVCVCMCVFTYPSIHIPIYRECIRAFWLQTVNSLDFYPVLIFTQDYFISCYFPLELVITI